MVAIVLVSGTFSIVAWSGDFSECTDNFHNATTPDYIDAKITNKSVALCFNGFATLYSGLSRTPLWSAEYLTRERLYQADEIPREDSFHVESRLPKSIRANLNDYQGSGYDRGHLAPNADMANLNQQYDSFSLANIVPQDPRNNRYVWRNIESVTRYLTKKHGEVYVITGVVFQGDKLFALHQRVLVPTHLFKALYIPAIGQAAAYYAPNDDSDRVEVISMDQLALRSGIDAFPSISSNAKAFAMELPRDVGELSADSRTKNNADSLEDKPLWYVVLTEVLHWLVDNFFPLKK